MNHTQSKECLVINMLIIFTFFSCVSVVQKEENESSRIINLEIESHKDFILNDNVLFNYISNTHLIESIGGYSELSNFLKDEDKKYFLEVLNSKGKDVVNSKLPNNFSFEEDLQLNEVEKFKIKRISVSKPIFSKKSDYVLIAYAFGYKNSMQGGIKKYNLIKGEWHFEQSFNLWVE